METAIREIVLWQDPSKRPEAVAAAEDDATRAAVRKAETEARLAVAQAKRTHAEIQRVGMEFVLAQLVKWMTISQHDDFKLSVGPIDPSTVMKLAEFVSKNFRLDNGQATENIAHAVTASVDFSKLSQAERNEWRRLAKMAGVEE